MEQAPPDPERLLQPAPLEPLGGPGAVLETAVGEETEGAREDGSGVDTVRRGAAEASGLGPGLAGRAELPCLGRVGAVPERAEWKWIHRRGVLEGRVGAVTRAVGGVACECQWARPPGSDPEEAGCCFRWAEGSLGGGDTLGERRVSAVGGGRGRAWFASLSGNGHFSVALKRRNRGGNICWTLYLAVISLFGISVLFSPGDRSVPSYAFSSW